MIPLVGASLWAAKRIVERATEPPGTDAAVYTFPRYTKRNAKTGVVQCVAGAVRVLRKTIGDEIARMA